MKTHAENKLRYESLEEELAQFKEEKFDLVKIFCSLNKVKQYIHFYKSLLTYTLLSCLVLIFLMIVL